MATPVLQGIGIGAPISYEAAERANQQRIEQQRFGQQLALREMDKREARKAASVSWLSSQLENKDFMSGTQFDPYMAQRLQETLQKGYQMAEKNVPTADMMVALAPDISRLTRESSNLKSVNANAEKTIQMYRGVPGINEGAVRSAYRQKLADTKSIDDIDPSKDYVNEVLQEGGKGIYNQDALTKVISGMKEDVANPTWGYAQGGHSAKIGYQSAIKPYQQLYGKDAYGRPQGVEVQHDYLTDDHGQTVNDTDGKPVRLLPRDMYSGFMSHPSVSGFINDETNKFFQEHGQKPPPRNSQQYELAARQVLYHQLEQNTPNKFSTIYEPKEAAAAVKIDLGRDPSALDAAHNYAAATHISSGWGPGGAGKTEDYPTVLSHVMRNNPDYTSGPVEDIPGNKGQGVNVTSMLPGGKLKYDTGSKDFYSNIWYNPKERQLYLENAEGKVEQVPEGKFGSFLNDIKGYNGKLSVGYLQQTLKNFNYSGGKFTSGVGPHDFDQRVQEAHEAVGKKEEQLRTTAADAFDASGDTKDLHTLVGHKTSGGTIKQIAKTSPFNWSNDYYIQFKDGSEKKFKGKADLIDYLKTAPRAEAPTSQGAAPAKTSAAPIQDLRKKYGY
jgi:hypothetical protein